MWFNIGRKDDFSDGDQWLVNANGRPIGLFRYNEQFYAIKNSCIHQGYPLY